MVRSTTCSGRDVVAEAGRWVGYLEHRDRRFLGIFDCNVGKGGCTAFAELVRQNSRRDLQGLPWCAVFVHCVFQKALGVRECKRLLGGPHAGTRVLARRMKRKRLWQSREYTPKAGDLIFLANDGRRIDHVGIVTDAAGGFVTSIDGNTVDPNGKLKAEEGGAVAFRTRKQKDARIIGYGRTGGIKDADF